MARAVESEAITLEEFAANVEEIFERVVGGNETIVVRSAEGKLALIKPMSSVRRKPKAGREADPFLAAAGSWHDFDVDTFLRNNRESRDLSARPHVELGSGSS